jgi:lipopolysaccharide/colanic/teichoic acid biosynthesis glycosyltransferase
LGTLLALIAGAYLVRRLSGFPGVIAVGFVLPTFAAVYALTAVIFLLFRIDYARFQFLAGFFLTTAWYFLALTAERPHRRLRLVLVPFGNAEALLDVGAVDWAVAGSPEELPLRMSGVVADLRSDMGPQWEAFLARCALKGLPVYHTKQIAESLTGRVQIDHLSENNLGSLLPSSVYLRFKRVIDFCGVIVALPVVVPLGLAAAAAIWLERSGPVLFRQQRIGYRGEVFTILKFRTMRQGLPGENFTAPDDPRITPLGRFLRRYRIDELPQIINILAGEMSWIGPRPESLPLALAYEERIPFYSYRHIVRPGITGWAQVNQGNVGEVAAATGKLQYDFYYIKNFSPWLDLLILVKTVQTVLTGFGAR